LIFNAFCPLIISFITFFVYFAKIIPFTFNYIFGVHPIELKSQALVSFKKYMPSPLPYFKVNICPFPLPHFASIFFTYL
jgi:hypothetical protein